MKNGIIYKVENLDNGRVYIGCTLNFAQRMGRHFSLAASGSTAIGFYPELKANPGQFIFQIVQHEVPLPQLKIVESEWISKTKSVSHGYNQCVYSGNEELSEVQVEEVMLMLETEIVKFSEIATMFGVDNSTISDINRGKSWRNPAKEYPLRKNTVIRKNLSVEDLRDIHAMLADESYSFADIANKYGWKSQAVVRKINAGTYSKSLYPANVYPIRPVDSRMGSRQR